MTVPKILLVAAVSVLTVALADSSWAGIIPNAISGVTGTAFQQGDSPDPGDGSISRTLNGSGLSVLIPGDPSTWTHNTAWQDNWQGNGTFSGGNTPGAWFVADLGATRSDLDAVHVWNVREVLDRGAKDVDVYYAVSPTVAPVTNSAYDFSSGGWTSLSSLTIPQATGGNTSGDAVVSLSGVPSARYIGFGMNTNWGSTFRTGFAELQFTTEPGPVIPIAGITGHQQGDSATGDGSIYTAINGAGTSKPDPNEPSTWTHTNSWQTDWQGNFPGGSPSGAAGGWAVIDLGEQPWNVWAKDLYLWNVNEGGGLDRGTNEFNIYYSDSPTVTPPAVGGGFQSYDFSSGGWTLLGGTQTLAQGTGSGTLPVSGVFDISDAKGARYIGVDILSNYGSTFRVGLAEIAVTGTLVPEPSTLALACLAALGLALCRRRRKR